MLIRKITDLYKKFEVYISVIGFSFGLIMTFLTLTRVDMFMENFWIIINLLIVVFTIFALTFYENHLKKRNLPNTGESLFSFLLPLFIQFAFGGLFATYFVFYIRSSSLSDSWLFLLILLVLLIGNEIWKKHYERLTFQISVLFTSFYLFFIFLLPVLWHRLGADLFLASGILSLIIIFLFTLLLRKFALEKFNSSHNYLKTSIVGIFLAMNIMYFTNIIPPIPLSLKEAGVYHSIVKVSGGQYQAKGEDKSWFDYFVHYPVFHKVVGEPVYVFSAIFSPVKFATQIIHQWQYYDEVKKIWVDSSKVVLPITGGREEGYRTYSSKSAVSPGLWRVKVMISSGQILGKIGFRVVNVSNRAILIESLIY